MSNPTSKKLTVVQIVPDMESGGVERGTVEVAQELVNQGHRSIVISGGGRLVEELEQIGSEHLSWPVGKKSPMTLAWIHKLRKFLLTESVDIVHARSRVPAWLCWLTLKTISKSNRPKFITTAHGLNSVSKYSEIMTRGDAVVAVSKTIRQYLKTSYPTHDDSRVHLIYRGRDPEAFPNGYQPSSNWRQDWESDFPQLKNKTILTLPGRLTRLKGHHDFLDMIQELRKTNYNIHGLIVGGEDPKRKAYAQELRQRIDEENLDTHVTLTGHRSDIRNIYAISNIVLSLSTKPESFGRTALEALSMGIPVVGYNHGGIGEILETVYPQGAVELGNASELIQKVNSIINSKENQHISEFEEFQLSTMLNQTLALYEKLAA